MALFQKQKQEKKRKGENVIGKIIYGFLLFMPLIAVGVACLYTIFNKNAYQSYSKSFLIEQTNEIQNAQELITGKVYYYIYDPTSTSTASSARIGFSSLSFDLYEKWANLPIHDYISFATYGANNNAIWYWDNNGTLASFYGDKIDFNFSFTAVAEDTNGSGLPRNKIYTTDYVENTLDNVFYYQMERLEQSDLFNWTKNTGTYTVMHNTTTLLGISNTYTPMIMTYWLIISIIYFLYDIALILIWAVHDKIHELKDAI